METGTPPPGVLAAAGTLTATVPQTVGSNGVGLGPDSIHPMATHLSWALPPVAALLGCIHGLTALDAQGALGPLQVRPLLVKFKRAFWVLDGMWLAVGVPSTCPYIFPPLSPSGCDRHGRH